MKFFAKKDLHRASTRVPKIVLDGVFFQFGDNSGIARVWSSLLQQWSGTPFGQSLVILDRNGAVPKYDGVGSYIPFKQYYSRSSAAETFLLEEVCRQQGADLFMSTHLTTPLETPSVFMVHDLIPELLGNDETWLREKRYCTYHSSAYLAVSDYSLSDLHRVYPFTKRIPSRVAHNGVSRDFHPVESERLAEFKKKYQIESPYFLVVGSRSAHKNIQLFYEAFSLLPDREKYSIVFCGGASNLEDEVAQRLHSCQIRMLNLPDEELSAAYSGALCLVFPSKYEGFGLPILEAMASGCPVIACANASIPEVAGDAALYVDDADPADLLRALNEVQRQSVRDKLIAAGFARAAKFSWDSTAKKISDFLVGFCKVNLSNQPTVPGRLWRDLRSYQCAPEVSLQQMRCIEAEWFQSVDGSAGLKSARL